MLLFKVDISHDSIQIYASPLSYYFELTLLFRVPKGPIFVSRVPSFVFYLRVCLFAPAGTIAMYSTVGLLNETKAPNSTVTTTEATKPGAIGY